MFDLLKNKLYRVFLAVKLIILRFCGMPCLSRGFLAKNGVGDWRKFGELYEKLKQLLQPKRSTEGQTAMNMCLKTVKAKLREEVKKQIATLTEQEIQRQSDIIANKLLTLTQYKDSKRISIYLSMKDEVQTDTIVKDILSSGKTCFIPRYTKTTMSMVKLNSLDDLNNLPLTKWNIRQPLETDKREDALEKGLDLMIVPGLAFTLDGGRMGRGKGYYDRYLYEYSNKTGSRLKTIGLALQQQIKTELPLEDTDQKLDLVVYPEIGCTIVSPETSKEYSHDFDGHK